MSSVKERIKAFARHKGLSYRELSHSMGVSAGYINSINKSMQPDKVSRLAALYPELNTAWLLTGEGEMINPGALPSDGGVTSVPLLPVRAVGGRLDDFIASAGRTPCDRIISPVEGAELAMEVTGDAMAPEYTAGSKILLKRIDETAFIAWGHDYVLDTVNGAVVRRIMPSEETGKVRCVAANDKYPPFDVAVSDVRGFYRILACVKMG